MIKKQMVKEPFHKFSLMINTLVVTMKQEL